jgi:phytoene synthase
MADPFEHCEALVRGADKDRYLATLFAAERYRRPLFALYAFNAEVATVRERARAPMPGEIRLQWWRDAVAGTRAAESSAHPVAAALLATATRYRLPPRKFTELLEARAFDLYDDPMATLEELEGYAGKTSSAVMEFAVTILNDGNDPGLQPLLRHAGIAYALAGLLASFPLHASRRQLYVPLDLLRRHGASVEDIFAGIATAELRAALSELRARARDHAARARGALRGLPPALAPAILPTALAVPMLGRLERRAVDPFALSLLPLWRRQWLLWRAARRPARIFG